MSGLPSEKRDIERLSNTKYTIFDCQIDDYFCNKLEEQRKQMMLENGRQNCVARKSCDIIGTLVG